MSFRLVWSVALMTTVLSVPSAFGQQTGTLKAKFVYGGSAFDPAAINVNKDTEFCGKHPLSNERLLVNKEDNGIKNVVFHVFTGRGGSKVPAVKAAAKTVTLANDKCRFEPRIVTVMPGDTLKITNPDAVGHNANLNFFVNTAQNITIPPGSEKDVPIEKAEPGVIPVDCNIHPWMRAYVVALDHPYAAVSDDAGVIEIKDLPAGKLSFRLYHEAADSAIKEITINGKKEALKRNILELEIKPGVNDLGTITIPADALKP